MIHTIKNLVDIIYPRHTECCKSPSRVEIEAFFEQLLGLIFPEYTDKVYSDRTKLALALVNVRESLYELLYFEPNNEGINADNNTNIFFDALPRIIELLLKDAKAMYDGDPAASSIDEVIRTYPGFYAISAYRMAHQLYKQSIQVIPRSITEIAHSKTGIDIHPGATIGEYFCIDHGTGIVIGETTIIGKHVKLYQGVTLGALSVAKADADIKRHPTLEDHVVVYAGATILGGNTIVGRGSVVGGNVWLPKSIDPGTKIYYKAQMHNGDDDITDLVIYKSVES